MNFTPSDVEKLLLSVAGMVARDRLARGVLLNHPEAVALLSTWVIERAREGARVADLMELAQLVADLSRYAGRSGPNERKVNSAAIVKKIRRTKEPESARQAKPATVDRRRRR